MFSVMFLPLLYSIRRIICFFQSVQKVLSICPLLFVCGLVLTVKKMIRISVFPNMNIAFSREVVWKVIKTTFIQVQLILKSGRSHRCIYRDMTHENKRGQKDRDKDWSNYSSFHQRCYRPHLATTVSEPSRKVIDITLGHGLAGQIIPWLLRQAHKYDLITYKSCRKKKKCDLECGITHEIKVVSRFLIQPSEMNCKKVFDLKELETNYQVSSSKNNIPAAMSVRRDVCFRDATTYRRRKKISMEDELLIPEPVQRHC